MKTALNELRLAVGDLKQPTPISDEQWQDFAEKTTVALMAGGMSSRFMLPGSENTNKNAYKLPNGDTMIEMTIRMYRDAGIKNFVALVFHNAHAIEDLLGDGSDMGVNLKYSYDPDRPIGKGGAVLNALENGSIPDDHNLIIHNPDDVVIGFEGSFPRHIVSGHLDGAKNGTIATVVAALSTPYAFSAMKINEGIVKDIETYPEIPLPTHIGVTIFSPETFTYFRNLISLDEKTDFEPVIFPALTEENKLGAVGLSSGAWLAVNEQKTYNKLVDYLDNS